MKRRSIDRSRIAGLMNRERAIFRERHARSGELAHQAGRSLQFGVLMTPFHNMALMSPATTAADVDTHTRIFDELAAELTAA